MAADLNSVIIIGRLTKGVTDDEYSFGYSNNGNARASLSLAVNSSKKDKNSGEWINEVSYFEAILWGKSAENLKPYLVKGQQLAIKGKLKQDRWEKDGKKGSKVYILVEEVELLGGKNNNNGGDDSSNTSSNKPAGSTFKANIQYQQQNFGDNDFPEDIPF